MAKNVLGYNPISDKIITIRIQGHPVDVTIIQVYAPTTAVTEDETKEFYGKLQEMLDRTAKKDVVLVLDDWNAKIGCEGTAGITGKFGLGERNEAGERLIECEENQLSITNTQFA